MQVIIVQPESGDEIDDDSLVRELHVQHSENPEDDLGKYD